MNTNYESILSYVYENEASLEGIIEGLSTNNINSKLCTVRFIIDLFNNSKPLQSESKENFFNQFVNEELLFLLVEILSYNESTIKLPANPNVVEETEIKEILESIIDSVVTTCSEEEDKKIIETAINDEIDLEYDVKKMELLKVHVAEILTGCFQILPSKVKYYIYHYLGDVKATFLSNSQTRKDDLMLFRVASLFLYSHYDGMKLEIYELFKGLLNPEIKENEDEFLDKFYENILPAFISYLTSSTDTFTMSLVLKLLNICASAHIPRMHHYVTHNNVLLNLKPLFQSKSKEIRIAMLNLLKSFISNNDDAMNMHVVMNDLLSPIFEFLKKNKHQNLITATCFDLLNDIATKNIYKLMEYIMNKYESVIEEGIYAENFVLKKISLKYKLYIIPESDEKNEEILTKKSSGINSEEIAQKRLSTEDNSDDEGEIKRKKIKLT